MKISHGTNSLKLLSPKFAVVPFEESTIRPRKLLSLVEGENRFLDANEVPTRD